MRVGFMYEVVTRLDSGGRVPTELRRNLWLACRMLFVLYILALFWSIRRSFGAHLSPTGVRLQVVADTL